MGYVFKRTDCHRFSAHTGVGDVLSCVSALSAKKRAVGVNFGRWLYLLTAAPVAVAADADTCVTAPEGQPLAGASGRVVEQHLGPHPQVKGPRAHEGFEREIYGPEDRFDGLRLFHTSDQPNRQRINRSDRKRDHQKLIHRSGKKAGGAPITVPQVAICDYRHNTPATQEEKLRDGSGVTHAAAVTRNLSQSASARNTPPLNASICSWRSGGGNSPQFATLG
jgi:hypothetical protein